MFLAALEQADPGLVVGEHRRDRGFRQAIRTCRAIDKDPELKGAELAIYVSQRFTSLHGEVSVAEARELAPVIAKTICPHL